MNTGKMVARLRGNPAYLHVILLGLEEVEKASRFRNLIIIVRDSGVCLGQVVGVVLPADFDGLQIKRW